MNKKQAGIIVTLLALIVCAGILAAKVNGPLEVTNSDFTTDGILTVNNDKGQEKTTNTDYFTSTRDKKQQLDTQTLANLKVMADDKNVDEASRNDASKKYTEFTLAQDHEQKIESVLKGRGFDDVICYIEDNNTKARVVIKTNEKELSSQKGKIIQDVVYSQAKIKNVEVELKQ